MIPLAILDSHSPPVGHGIAGAVAFRNNLRTTADSAQPLTAACDPVFQ